MRNVFIGTEVFSTPGPEGVWGWVRVRVLARPRKTSTANFGKAEILTRRSRLFTFFRDYYGGKMREAPNDDDDDDFLG